MVSVGRILRDYRDAGSVNGLSRSGDSWTTHIPHESRSRRRGLPCPRRGLRRLSHPQRQALAHRFEAALRLLDEHCRVYQYLLKRTVAPFVAAACQQPIANEAIQRRAVLERPTRRAVRPLALSGSALRSAACACEEH